MPTIDEAVDKQEKEAAKKKKKEGLKATRAAEKKAKKLKAQKEAKKIGDKLLVDMAEKQPAGGGKTLLLITHALDKIEEQISALNLAKRGERAKLKEMKVELRVYDHVRKLRKMDPEDARSFKATEALYTEQLGMELSPEQKKQIEEINERREAAKTALAAVHGDDTGKEVGSSTMPASEEETNAEVESTPDKETHPGVTGAAGSSAVPDDNKPFRQPFPTKNPAFSGVVKAAAGKAEVAH